MQPSVKPLLAEETTVHTVWYQKLISGIMECHSLHVGNTILLRRRYWDTSRKEKECDPREIIWEPGANAAPHGEFKGREKELYVVMVVAEKELEKGSREVQWRPSGWWMGWDFMDGTVTRATWGEGFWRQLSPAMWRRERWAGMVCADSIRAQQSTQQPGWGRSDVRVLEAVTSLRRVEQMAGGGNSSTMCCCVSGSLRAGNKAFLSRAVVDGLLVQGARHEFEVHRHCKVSWSWLRQIPAKQSIFDLFSPNISSYSNDRSPHAKITLWITSVDFLQKRQWDLDCATVLYVFLHKGTIPCRGGHTRRQMSVYSRCLASHSRYNVIY